MYVGINPSFITTHQRRLGKVIFSVMSVCPQGGRKEEGGPQVQGPGLLCTGLHPLLMASGGQDWRLVQTCSPEDIPAASDF